jgi:hypothetical protein
MNRPTYDGHQHLPTPSRVDRGLRQNMPAKQERCVIAQGNCNCRARSDASSTKPLDVADPAKLEVLGM